MTCKRDRDRQRDQARDRVNQKEPWRHRDRVGQRETEKKCTKTKKQRDSEN